MLHFTLSSQITSIFPAGGEENPNRPPPLSAGASTVADETFIRTVLVIELCGAPHPRVLDDWAANEDEEEATGGRANKGERLDDDT